mgnify:CR=1 FL=1
MERVADKVGLRTDLMATFHENAEIVNDVLTLVCYSFTTGNSWSRAARWQKLEKAPSSRELTPMTITRLTQSISETERMNLFKYRADRLGKDELCAVDSTTRSAYDSSLADIKWDRNKEHVPLPQTSEVVVYSLDSHMPVCNRTFPGNIPDSRSVETILTDINHAGFPGVILVTDRGYESVQNLEKYILRGQPMIMCVKMRQKIVLDRIAEFGTIGGKPGRLFILFVSLIISSYVRHIWKTTGLKKQFASTQDILDEMRSIRCIEHNGRAKFITPFVGAQKDICKAFGFDIPEGCGTEYKSRKVSQKRR